MIRYKQVPSPNFGYGRGVHGQNDPEAIVWHITASRPTSPPPAGRVAVSASAKNNKAFWQELVVAAVSAGKSADEAVQLANRVVDSAD